MCTCVVYDNYGMLPSEDVRHEVWHKTCPVFALSGSVDNMDSNLYVDPKCRSGSLTNANYLYISMLTAIGPAAVSPGASSGLPLLRSRPCAAARPAWQCCSLSCQGRAVRGPQVGGVGAVGWG